MPGDRVAMCARRAKQAQRRPGPELPEALPKMIDTHASLQYCTYVGQSMRKHPTRPGAEECATVLNMMPATLSRGIPPIKIGRKSRAPSQRQCSNAKANASDGLALERVLALLELHARRALRASLNRTLLHQ